MEQKQGVTEDRRQGDRRKGGGAPPQEDRRKSDRRAPGKESGPDA